MLTGIIGIMIAIFSFTVLIDIPRRYVITAAAVGILNGCVYLVSIHFGAGKVLAAFFAAFAAALVSHIFARVLKAPVSLFLIIGIFPTVPGSGMYRIVKNIIDNSPEIADSIIYTLEIAGVIALAIFLVDTIFRIRKITQRTI